MAKVIVYSTPTCPWCIKAKEWLKENNVEFDNKDVGEDESARNEMLEKSGQMGVPVLDIGGKIIIGFDVDQIKEALGKGEEEAKPENEADKGPEDSEESSEEE